MIYIMGMWAQKRYFAVAGTFRASLSQSKKCRIQQER
jgi:hypothetical protein